MKDSLPPAGDGPGVELIHAVLGGDPNALDRWYRTEHPVVYRLALGLLADAHEAEDLAQDAMLHLFDRLSRWDATRAYEPWRTTVVLNLCRDRRRRRLRRPGAGGARLDPLDPKGLEATLGTLPDPAHAAQAGEVREILAAALGALPEREREAFVLRDLEGHSSAEAAAAMGIAASSVRSLLALARRRLRGLLGPHLVAGTEAGGGAA